MKEQWKRLDSDAKVLLNVEEGRSLPIKIELPLSAFSQDKDDCCKRLLVTLRIFILLSLLVLLGWLAMTLYMNYRTKSSVVMQDNEIPTYFNEANKIIFKKKVWEEDIKNVVTNDALASQEIEEKTAKKSSFVRDNSATTRGFGSFEIDSKKIESYFKPQSEFTESEQVPLDQVIQNLQNLIDKIKTDQEVTENTVKEEVNFTQSQEDENKQEALPFISFLGSIIDPILFNESGENIQDSTEKIQEENKNLINDHEEEAESPEYEKNESEESNSKSTLVHDWLDILGLENIFPAVNENNKTQNNLQEFSDESEEAAAKKDIDRVLMEMAGENQNALDEFVKEFIKTVGNFESVENASNEFSKQKKLSEDETSAESQSSTENKTLVDSEDKSENSDQKLSSEETMNYHNDKEGPFMKVSDLTILTDPIVLPTTKESTNLSVEELSKTDEDDITQSNEHTPRDVVQKDIFLVMARQIEAMLGEYDNLLIWYFKHRNGLEPVDNDDQIKYFTARLLFGKDITEFSSYSIYVMGFLMNSDSAKDLSRLADQSQPKLQAETRTQAQIINRLITKLHILELYKQGEENAEEIAEVIESINLLELKLSGIDVDIFLNNLEENKTINESVKEENISDKITDSAEKMQQAIEAMRRVSHFHETNAQEARETESNESRKHDSKESSDDTSSLIEVSDQNTSEDNNHKAQLFIQAMYSADVSESQQFNKETNKNSDRLIKENGESSPEISTKESKDISSWNIEPTTMQAVKSESGEVTVQAPSDELTGRRQAFIKALERISEITKAEHFSEEFEKNNDQSINEDEEESSPEATIKKSEDIFSWEPSWEPVQPLQSINDQEPIVEEVRSDENPKIDAIEDELTKRLQSVMEDVLNSKDESEESVNMNDFLTIYDGFDY